ncbi:MAG: sensor histidine kinase [Janthinobacterium lividum]
MINYIMTTENEASYLKQELYELQKSDSTVFNFLQESFLDGLWYWNLDEPDSRWGNAKFWQTLGYSPDALPNSAAAWHAALDREDWTATERHIQECVDNQADTYHQLLRGAHRDGSTVWLHCQGLVVRGADNRPQRLLVALLDITQRRNEEVYAQEVASHYGSILSNQSVYIVKTDPQGLYTYANDFFYERFGWDSTIIGTSSLLGILEEDWPKCLAVVGRCFAEPETPHQVILRKPYKDRSIKSNHWEFKGIVNGDGQVGEILCVGYDVTLLVDNLKQSKNLLDITNRQNTRLQNFAYIISHNIRSHSANLTALVKLMQEAVDEEQASMFLQMLKTSTDKLAETIVNLNEIVTANSNAHQPKEARRLKPEVDKTLEALNVLLHQGGITVSVNIPADVVVYVVPAYLDSILLNLFSNAIKYRSAKEAPVIAVSCFREGEFLVLVIRDNGLGIDLVRNRAKVFGMYKTFHNNEDARGVGLFITKNQIEAMNGRIELESEVGAGSTFKVYFNENEGV